MKEKIVEKIVKAIKKATKVKNGANGNLRNYDKKGRYT